MNNKMAPAPGFLIKGVFILLLGLHLTTGFLQTSNNCLNEQCVTTKGRKNVLMIIADDMRAEVAALKDAKKRPWLNADILTPNLDKLATHSLLLKQAFAQVARCNPSRSSFLTGRRPDTIHVYNNHHFFRTTAANLVTLPGYFRQNGYHTVGVGKVFHSRKSQHELRDEEYSFSEPLHAAERRYDRGHKYAWMSITAEERKKTPLRDETLRDIALEKLQQVTSAYHKHNQNFFLTVGFETPHLPFVCPEEFYDLYPLHKVQTAANDFSPSGMSDLSWSDSRELLLYGEMLGYKKHWKVNSTFPTLEAKHLRRAYYSCVTYIDSLIGDVLNKLDELNMRDDTVVVFLGDHGWHLGENAIWGKNTNFEAATHAPVMFSIPGLTDAGLETDNLVELVDLFPSLAEAAGLPVPPQCPAHRSEEVNLCTEGSSWIPLAKDPATTQWKTHVFSQYPFPDLGAVVTPDYMGHSIRTQRYRYTEWVNFTGGFPQVWPQPVGVELYDLQRDPMQTANKANHDGYSDVIQRLAHELHKGWHGALLSEGDDK